MPAVLQVDEMTAQQKECYEMLGEVFGGAHHVPGVYAWGDGIKCNLIARLATFDFDYLTRLVVLAHDRCIRVGIIPSGPRLVGIEMHKRQRDGGAWIRHPTIEEAIRIIRAEGDSKIR